MIGEPGDTFEVIGASGKPHDGGKNPKAVYVPGPAIDPSSPDGFAAPSEPVAMVTGFGGALAHEYFHTNHQGSVISMSNDNGRLVEGPFLYDPYGSAGRQIDMCHLLK